MVIFTTFENLMGQKLVTQSSKIEVPSAVQLKFFDSLVLRYSCTSLFPWKMESSSSTVSFDAFAPNSDGIKCFTPTFTAISMYLFWSVNADMPTTEITTSWPVKADSISLSEKSDLWTWTIGGYEVLFKPVVSTVTLKSPESTRESRIILPISPDAYVSS